MHKGWTAGTLAVAVGLSGCASWVAPTPPVPPTDATVQTRAIDLAKIQAGGPGKLPVTPKQFMDAGTRLTRQNCEAFFDSLTKRQGDTEFNKTTAANTATAAAAVLALTKSPQTAIALTALGFGLVTQTIEAYEKYELFQAYPDDIHALVQKAMADYLAASPTNPADMDAAADIVSGYAYLCTRSGINHLARVALSTATTGAKPGAGATMFGSSDQAVLDSVNTTLGTSQLSDDQYVMLEILADGGVQNDTLRTGILKQFAQDFQDKIYDKTSKTLTPAMVTAGKELIALAKTNGAFAARAKAIRDQNTPPTTPVTGGVASNLFEERSKVFTLPPARAVRPTVTVNGVPVN